jgi:hypothetical protein
LLLALTLAAVTTWYAVLTRRISRASEQAANQSLKAAEASLLAAQAAATSAAAAIANVPVDFSISPITSFTVDEPPSVGPGVFSVQLRARGAAVFVHGLVLDYVGTPLQVRGHVFNRTVGINDMRLECEAELPQRIHDGEELQFFLPGPEQRIEVGSIHARVEYTLDGTGDVSVRRVEYRGRFGRDYTLDMPTADRLRHAGQRTVNYLKGRWPPW